jgi:hypothetical protein
VSLFLCTSHRQNTPISGPHEFAMNLKAFTDKVAATCPLCGHREVQGDREEGENISPVKSLSYGVSFSDHPDQIFRGSFTIQLLFL